MALVIMLGALGSFQGIAAAEPKGVIFLAQTSGQVKVQVDGQLDPTGKPLVLSAEEVKAGTSIFDGHAIVTGKAKGSSAILLFSNGAVVTLKEDSHLRLRKFLQTKFDSSDKKIIELEEEPSTSLTMLHLNYGDMTVGVKKLQKKSRFQVSSPLGTTEFRSGREVLSQVVLPSPGGGWQGTLVVPKGVVTFRPASPPPPPPGESPAPPPDLVHLQAGQAIRPIVTIGGLATVPNPAPAAPAQMLAAMESVRFAFGLTNEVTLDSVSATTAREVVAKLDSTRKFSPTPEPEPESEPTPEPDSPGADLNGKRLSLQSGSHLENAPLGDASKKSSLVNDKSEEDGKVDRDLSRLRAGTINANGAVGADALADDETTTKNPPDATSRLRHDGVQNNDRGRGPWTNGSAGAGGGKRQERQQPPGRHPKNRAELVNWTEQKVWSQVAYNTPKTIAYEELSYIQLSINPSFTAEEIAEVVKERGPVETSRIKVTREMEATLTGSAFKITPISSERQMIELDDTTTWKWEIIPLEPGRHRVHLVINAIVRVAGKELKRSKSFDRYIEIEVTGFQRTVIFMQKNWPWLALAFAPLIFLGPLRSSFWKNRRAAKALSVSKHDENRNLDVFVSYSSKDRVVVLQLVEELRAHGYNVWVDRGGIHGASQWSEQIVHAIEGASAFILVGSSHSFASHNVVKETSLASERRKHVIPVFIEETPIPQSLQYQLAGLQHVDYHEQIHDECVRRIVETLNKLGVVGSEEAS